MAETFVDSFTHLTGRPHSDKALPILKRIASLVKPIMRKHGWRLPVLAEFFPDNDALVDVNGGEKILLRLRPVWAPDTFYEEDQIVRVMLHELTHNVHGPHDDKFYKFLAGLEDEYDALQRSGYSGEGFFTPGHRLGTGVSHNVPLHLARTKALEAAERRRRMAGVLGNSGGQRLGGRPVAGADHWYGMRELAAQAAERRAHDEKSCGAGHGTSAIQEAEKAARDGVEDMAKGEYEPHPWLYDEATGMWEQQALEANAQWVCPRCTLQNPPLALQCSACMEERPNDSFSATPPKVYDPPPGPPPRHTSQGPPPIPTNKPRLHAQPKSAAPPALPPNKPAKQSNIWSCPVCTLDNPNSNSQCSACLARRPLQPSDGWSCPSCGEHGNPHQFWSCRFCGSIKQSSASVY